MARGSVATQGVLVAVGCLALALAPVAEARPVPNMDQGVETLRSIGKTFTAVAREASKAVVFLSVSKGPERGENPQGEGVPEEFFEHPFFRRFFGPGGPGVPGGPGGQGRGGPRVQGQGSGFLVSAEGHILTNNHVVEGADKVSVKLLDGRTLEAGIVGTDPHSDVAVLRLQGKVPTDLPIVELGDSDHLEVGEWVLAVGNPFGLSHTVTAGIVSALGRNRVGITDYEDFIQTDAAINPGNSGGPLLDLDGRVVGINTAIFSRSGGYMGIGFSIPINMAKAVYRQILETGSVRRGFLGLAIQDLTPGLAKAFELPNDRKGILVGSVEEGSAAHKAGIEAGDVLLELDGTPITDTGDFRNRVALKPPGTKVSLVVLRDGARRDLVAILGERTHEARGGRGPAQTDALRRLGLALEDGSPDLRRRFGLGETSGVVVSEVTPGSVAAEAGIEPGNLVREVDRRPVRSAAEAAQRVSASLEDGRVLLLVQEGRMARYVVLEAPPER